MLYEISVSGMKFSFSLDYFRIMDAEKARRHIF